MVLISYWKQKAIAYNLEAPNFIEDRFLANTESIFDPNFSFFKRNFLEIENTKEENKYFAINQKFPKVFHGSSRYAQKIFWPILGGSKKGFTTDDGDGDGGQMSD